METSAIVDSLRSQGAQLRQAGVGQGGFAAELTYLLFLKMVSETGAENELPHGYRWRDLLATHGTEQLEFYAKLLLHLSGYGSARVKAIFAHASTRIDVPRTLHKLVSDIERLDWFAARDDGVLHEMFEELLKAHAANTKSKSGGIFTPRVLIQAIVQVVRPHAGEVFQDPALGTGGFLIAADAHVKQQTDRLSRLSPQLAEFHVQRAFTGMELEPAALRLGLMNLMLHGTGDPLELASRIRRGNTLSNEGAELELADVILTNPPFGATRGGGKPNRSDFTFPTSDWPLAFLQHVYRRLRPPRHSTPGGRAAVVVPDNVLFQEQNKGPEVRRDLLDKCNLHTILRLPGSLLSDTKANVLFFDRGSRDTATTTSTWIYDLRTNMPSFGKRNRMTLEHFADFIHVFGDDPHAQSLRRDEGETGRFRQFSRADLARRGDNLNITWLRDESASRPEDLPDPDALAQDISNQLETALQAIRDLRQLLAGK
jgi:type I restriction enzyme M protein